MRRYAWALIGLWFLVILSACTEPKAPAVKDSTAAQHDEIPEGCREYTGEVGESGPVEPAPNGFKYQGSDGIASGWLLCPSDNG